MSLNQLLTGSYSNKPWLNPNMNNITCNSITGVSITFATGTISNAVITNETVTNSRITTLTGTTIFSTDETVTNSRITTLTGTSIFSTDNTTTNISATTITGSNIYATTAVNLPSSDALSSFKNVGNWTPTLWAGGSTAGVVYSQQLGKYFKIGNGVMIQFHLQITTAPSTSGAITISGLPFNPSSASLTSNMWIVGATGTNLTNTYPVMAFNSGQPHFNVNAPALTGSYLNFNQSNCSNAMVFGGAGWYGA